MTIGLEGGGKQKWRTFWIGMRVTALWPWHGWRRNRKELVRTGDRALPSGTSERM